MAKSFTALSLSLGTLIAVAAGAACSSNTDTLGNHGSSSGSSGSASGGTGDGGTAAGGPSAEEALFRALEGDFKKTCGNQCHVDATYKPTPPAFLGPPDAYKSIKAQPGVVIADYYSSTILNHGAHAGPAIGDTPDLEAKVIDWLKLEAAVIQSVSKPTTDPVAIVNGPNDIDMAKASIGGLTGVHLLFDATLLGSILSISNIKVHAPAGTDVHVYQPKFYRVLAKADANGQTEYADGADTFSNTDQTVPGGADTVLAPGSAIFTAPNFQPFDLASDKIRIEMGKLEPGKIVVVAKPKTCVNVPNFTANVLPMMKGGGGFPNCNSCHNAGLAGLSLAGADQTVVCNQVLGKLNTTDITKSLIITHVIAGGGHGGPTVADAAGWTKVWTDNMADFF